MGAAKSAEPRTAGDGRPPARFAHAGRQTASTGISTGPAAASLSPNFAALHPGLARCLFRPMRTNRSTRPKRGSLMHIRLVKLAPPAAALAALIGLGLVACPAAAQQGTPEQRAACEGDAT